MLALAVISFHGLRGGLFAIRTAEMSSVVYSAVTLPVLAFTAVDGYRAEFV